jgi:pimeloyl-ACP methyl ester carboxylesterase
VGRADELESLEQALDDVERGPPGAIELVGEPGIGKTRLLAELAARAELRGYLVLSGSASELEGDLPFSVFVHALDEYVESLDHDRLAMLDADVQAELAHVLPSLSALADGRAVALQHERYRSHRAVPALLEQLAHTRPLVLVLDDFHWADSASVELLGALLRRPPAAAVLVALSVRTHQMPERLASALERAHRAAALTRIEVGGLTPAEARELLADIVDASGAAVLYQESGGNPFYLEQLARPLERGNERCDLYYEQEGKGVPILLVPPSGSTASTWGTAADDLARIGRVIVYDRRGYARSGGEPPRRMSAHTTDAAALLERVGAEPAVVVGTSAGAAIAVDLAVRRPDLVRAVVAHEFPWQFARHLPTASQVAALVEIGSLVLRGRQTDAAEALLRNACSYRDGGTAWDAFPEECRRIARENAGAALTDFVNSIGTYPSRMDLATVKVPVVCSYGARSPSSMFRLTRLLASAIPTARTRRIEEAGHAAPFDATTNFVRLIADSITSRHGDVAVPVQA